MSSIFLHILATASAEASACNYTGHTIVLACTKQGRVFVPLNYLIGHSCWAAFEEKRHKCPKTNSEFVTSESSVHHTGTLGMILQETITLTKRKDCRHLFERKRKDCVHLFERWDWKPWNACLFYVTQMLAGTILPVLLDVQSRLQTTGARDEFGRACPEQHVGIFLFLYHINCQVVVSQNRFCPIRFIKYWELFQSFPEILIYSFTSIVLFTVVIPATSRWSWSHESCNSRNGRVKTSGEGFMSLSCQTPHLQHFAHLFVALQGSRGCSYFGYGSNPSTLNGLIVKLKTVQDLRTESSTFVNLSHNISRNNQTIKR